LVQLRDFASGVRASALMSPIAKALSPDDIADVTAYFAAVNAPFLPLKTGNAALVKRGDRLLERRRFFRDIGWHHLFICYDGMFVYTFVPSSWSCTSRAL
jgi:hypothetical protein